MDKIAGQCSYRATEVTNMGRVACQRSYMDEGMMYMDTGGECSSVDTLQQNTVYMHEPGGAWGINAQGLYLREKKR